MKLCDFSLGKKWKNKRKLEKENKNYSFLLLNNL